jgi:hypothetical protein
MTRNPEVCDCGSQLFVPVWGVKEALPTDTDTENKEEVTDAWKRAGNNPTAGNSCKMRVGYKCAECGNIQLTAEIPEPHAKNNDLSLPKEASRDFV